MHAEFSNAHFKWSFSAISKIFMIGKSGTCSTGLPGALHCVHAGFVPVFQCYALKRDIKVQLLFLAPDLINAVISQYSGEYGQ